MHLGLAPRRDPLPGYGARTAPIGRKLSAASTREVSYVFHRDAGEALSCKERECGADRSVDLWHDPLGGPLQDALRPGRSKRNAPRWDARLRAPMDQRCTRQYGRAAGHAASELAGSGGIT